MFSESRDSDRAWCTFTTPFKENGPNAAIFFFRQEDGGIKFHGSADKEVAHLLKGLMSRGLKMNQFPG